MKPARGFVALLSAIMIGTVLMGAAAVLSQELYATRFDRLQLEYRTTSWWLAHACLEQALDRLADNERYVVPEDPAYNATTESVSIPLGNLYGRPVSCTLYGPTDTPPQVHHVRTYTVGAGAAFEHSLTHLEGTLRVRDPNVPGEEPRVEILSVHEAP